MPYSKDNFPLPAAAYIGFALTSVITTLIGPLLPLLQLRWHLTDQAGGFLFTAQFSGYMLGVLASGILLQRCGGRVALIMGYFLLAVGPLGLAFGSMTVGLASITLSGIGLGIVDPATNFLVTAVSPHRRTVALNVLNYIFCIGAVLYPILILIAQRLSLVAASLSALSLALGTVAFLLWLLPFSSLRAPSPASARILDDIRDFYKMAPKWLTLLFGIFLFLYIGLESATSGWVVSFASRHPLIPKNLVGLLPSCFWLFLLVGRAAAPFFLRFTRGEHLILASLVAAGAGTLILLYATYPLAFSLGVALAGLGYAAIFPTTLANLTKHLGNLNPGANSALFALGGLGGAVIPWAVGITATLLGGLHFGISVVCFGIFLLIFVQGGILWISRTPDGTLP